MDDIDFSSPLFARVTEGLSDPDATNLKSWAATRPYILEKSNLHTDDAVIAMTAAVCGALQQSASGNAALQGALETMLSEVVLNRSAVFLPPDPDPDPHPPGVPHPQSIILLPPDGPTGGGNIETCESCGQPLP